LPPQSWEPELLLLPGGRSNITANEFSRSAPLKTLGKALKIGGARTALRPAESQAASEAARRAGIGLHPLLRIEQAGRTPQHGFLFAGAMIDHGIRLCRQNRRSGNGWLHTGPLADVIYLARLGIKVATGRSPLPPYPHLAVETDQGQALHAPARLVLASTLPLAKALYNPFAEREAGVVRVTAVAADAKRFWSRLPRLIRGNLTPDMNLANGYLSGRCGQVEISGLSGYSLDGEAFEADPTQPLVIRGGPRLRILKS
jgi:hypothetical protein